MATPARLANSVARNEPVIITGLLVSVEPDIGQTVLFRLITDPVIATGSPPPEPDIDAVTVHPPV